MGGETPVRADPTRCSCGWAGCVSTARKTDTAGEPKERLEQGTVKVRGEMSRCSYTGDGPPMGRAEVNLKRRFRMVALHLSLHRRVPRIVFGPIGSSWTLGHGATALCLIMSEGRVDPARLHYVSLTY